MGFLSGFLEDENDELKKKIEILEKENHELNLQMLRMRNCGNCKNLLGRTGCKLPKDKVCSGNKISPIMNAWFYWELCDD